jgi:GMP synthase-like glutamine amidotransferase
MPEKKQKKKVLIIDYGSNSDNEISNSAQNLKNMYNAHTDKSGIKYEFDIKTEKDLLKLKKENKGNELNDYHIIHQSGSRIRKLGEDAAKYLMKTVHDNTYMIGTCHGAQEIAKHHKVEAKRLKEHQKGKQGIQYQGNREGESGHIHKNHRWGIQVNPNSNLEAIATSKQKFHEGGEGEIYEIFKVEGKNHYGIQGHGEQGVGKEIMYKILDDINNPQQKAKKQEKKYKPTE